MSKAKETKLALRVSDELGDFLNRYGQKASASVQARDDLTCWMQALSMQETEMQGQLTANEAGFFAEALKDHYYFEGFFGAAQALLPALAGKAVAAGTAAKWQVNGKALIERCKELTVWQAYIVFHWARLYWAEHKDLKNPAAIARAFRCWYSQRFLVAEHVMPVDDPAGQPPDVARLEALGLGPVNDDMAILTLNAEWNGFPAGTDIFVCPEAGTFVVLLDK